MYIRPIRVEELVQWLEGIDHENYVVEDLAQMMVDKFDILISSTSPV